MELKNFSDAALKLDAVFKTASDGIILINENGIVEMANDAASQIFGYTPKEMIGWNVSILMNKKDAERHNQYLTNYLTTGEKKIIGIGREVVGKKKDGTLFPLRLSVSEVRIGDKSIFTGILHDLTEEKKAEKALQTEKEKAQSYLDIAQAIILVLDTTGKILLVNKKGCQILDYLEHEIKGQNCNDLALFTSDSRFKNHIKIIYQGKYWESETESEIVLKNGDKKIIAWRTAAIFDHKNNILSTISSGIDITLRKQAEDKIKILNIELENRVEARTEELADAVNQLLNINKQLQFEIKERKNIEQVLRDNEQQLRNAYEKERELNELKSRFVSMASHEFRTPLSTILSSADLIEAYIKESEQEKRTKHTHRIKSSVSNLTGILNDFLSISKLEEGKTFIQPREVDLNELIEEIYEEVQGLLKTDQKIIIEKKISRNFITDRTIVKNILLNLISNAIKYSPHSSEIYFNANLENQKVYLTIKDQGIGIPEEEQEHLFTRFFRAYNAENIQGTGLGLNIVKRYLDLLNGSINFKSKINMGTEFNLVIPEINLNP
jgi:PAS domain S-box-containing protein